MTLVTRVLQIGVIPTIIFILGLCMPYLLTIVGFFTFSSAAWAEEEMPNPITLTITHADTGDRGCYISGQEKQKDGSVQERSLMAEHGCEYTLIVGKTYTLSWTGTPVLAMECEGDVDCGKSDIEPIVQSFTEIKQPEQSCWEQAQSQSAMNSCAYEDFTKADEELNRVYHSIRSAYSSDTLFLKQLHVAQRAWVAFRDAELTALFPQQENIRLHYGSVYPMCHNAVLTRLTLDRIKQLRVWLDGIEEGDVCRGSVKVKR